jgi:hypothetical protein
MTSEPSKSAAVPIGVGPAARESEFVRIGVWLGAALVAVVGYLVATSPGLQTALGAGATALVRPVVVPLLDLINVPAFVYCAALLILLAGVAACIVYQVASLRPSLAELRRVRAAVGRPTLPRMRARSQMRRTFSVPRRCWVMPMP